MTNPYAFEINGLRVVVYAANKTVATQIFNEKLSEYNKQITVNTATEILKDIEGFCKDNTRQSFNWSEIWLGLWKILKEKYGAEH